MKDAIEICEAIQKLGTRAELELVYVAYKGRVRELAAGDTATAKKKFSLQQEVTFKYRGRIIAGKIIRKNEKTARVSVPAPNGRGYAQQWNIAYTLLSPDYL